MHRLRRSTPLIARAIEQEGLHRGDAGGVGGSGGRVIRHAFATAPPPVRPLPVSVVQAAVEALLMPAVGLAPLLPKPTDPARVGAVLVPPVAATADVEENPAGLGRTDPLAKDGRTRPAWHPTPTSGAGQRGPVVAPSPLSVVGGGPSTGLLIDPGRRNRPGSSSTRSEPKATPPLPGPLPTRASGADDAVPVRPACGQKTALLKDRLQSRQLRQAELGNRCFVARGLNKGADTVVGIATEQYVGLSGFSLDVVHLHMPVWNDKHEEHMRRMQAELGYFAKTAPRRVSEDEYPQS